MAASRLKQLRGTTMRIKGCGRKAVGIDLCNVNRFLNSDNLFNS